MSKKTKLVLWMKFKPEYATTQKGTAMIPEPYQHHYQKARLVDKLLRLAKKHQAQGHLWQFRIYDQPSNDVLESWAQYQQPTPTD